MLTDTTGDSLATAVAGRLLGAVEAHLEDEGKLLDPAEQIGTDVAREV